MPEALGESAGVSAAVPESAPSVKPVSASAVTEPEPEPVLVVASAPVAEPDPVLADESAPESVPVSESAPAAESIAVAVAVSVTSGLSRQDASMEGQSDKASGTGHDAAVRTGREGLPDRLPVRWLLPPLKPMPNRSRKSSYRTVCSIWTIW